MLSFQLLLTFGFSFLGAVHGLNVVKFECPNSEGKFPYPSDCHKYYTCTRNIAKLENCSENQGFHETWNDCVWEGFVEACSANKKEPLCGKNDETDHTDPRKEIPWIVAVFQRDRDDQEWEYVSPGVIIGPNTVMTTCRLGRMINGKFRASANASAIRVIAAAESLDEANQDEFSQILQVSYIQTNAKHTEKSYDFCNALLHLKDTIKLDTPYAKSICLPFWKSPSKNKNNFGYTGMGVLSTYAERSDAPDGFAHIISRTFRLASREYCVAHTLKKNTFCGVSQSGDNLVEICMTHRTISAAKMPSDPRWFLLGYGSNANGGLCSIKNLDDDQKLPWIANGIRCGAFRYPCGNGKCIDLNLVCNNQADCPNGEDEDAKWCRARNPCINSATFECGVYENCIEAKKVCDGFPDCYDASDEDPNTCKNVKKKNTVPFYVSLLSDSTTGAQTEEVIPEVTASTPTSKQPTPTPTGESKAESGVLDENLQNRNKPVVDDNNPGPAEQGFPTQSEIQPRNSNNMKRNCSKLVADEGTILKCSVPSGKADQDCSGEAEVGSIATYQCKRFYKPGLTSGSTLTRKCFDDTRWKPERYFECVPDCGLLLGGTSNAYIVNGQTVDAKNRFPWHAAIFTKTKNKYEYICGGTLIHKSFVVTAAHCVTDINGDNNRLPATYQIALAPSTSDFEKLQRDSNVQLFQVKKIQVNGHYDPTNNYQSDIALLELAKPSILGADVMLACLPGKDIPDPTPGKIGKVVGFGYDEAGKITDTLKFANMPIVTTEDCITKVNFIPSINQICAGYTNGTGVCFGDSGGGLVFFSNNQRYYLHGIVSVGPKVENRRKRSLHCNHNTYSVYTSVPRFVDWIYDQINLMEMEL